MRFVCPVFLAAAILIALCIAPPAAVAQTSVLIPANVTLAPQGNFSFSVTLSKGAAPLDGITITLTSSNPSVASVWPATLYVPWEMTEAPRRLAIVTGFSPGTATISASAPGYATGQMQVQVTGGGGSTPVTGTLSLSPASIAITGTGTQNITVQLSAAAPAGGVAVGISSSNAFVASVPSTANVPAGFTTASVPVTGVGAGSATITATAANYGSATAAVTVSNPSSVPASGILVPSSLNLAPGEVRDYPIELPTPAPAGGVYVTVLSSDTSKVAPSQGGFSIPETMSSAPRRMTTVSAMGSGVATITVSAPGYASATTQVQVGGGSSGGTPTPGGGTMSFSPATLNLAPNETKTLTLVLSSPAGAAGLPVSLTSSNRSAADVPVTINIPAGSATFNVPVAGIGSGNATISASASGYGNATATVTVAPITVPSGMIQVPPAINMTPGQSSAFPVTLAAPAGSSGTSITLTSSDPSKAVISPSTFLIPAGSTSVRRDEPVVTALGAGLVTITASAPGYTSGISQIQVQSSSGGSMTLSPATLSLITGATQNLTLAVTGAIPTTGVIIYLTSSNTAAATVPVSVTLPSWSSSIAVPVSAVGSGSSTITAAASGFGNATATVTVSGAAQVNLPSSTTLTVGETINFPVTLSAAASADTLISFSSSDPTKLTVYPSAFTIPKGMTAAPGIVTTISGVAAGSAIVTASAAGYTAASRQITVTSTPTTGLTMGLSPSSLSFVGSGTQSVTLTLSGSAPPGGLLVTLTSSNAAVATVPAAVSVPYGSTNVSFLVTAVGAGSTVITAAASGIPNATATVTVTPVSGGGTLSLPASWGVAPNQSNQLQATLNPPAPAGTTVTFTSSNPSKATVTPATVTVPSGVATATVQVNGVADGTTTITASAPGYTSASTLVQVYTSTGSSVFIPGILAMSNVGLTQTVQVSLGPQSPAGVTVTLVSSNPAVVTVPSTVVVPPNSYSVNVPVTSVTPGTAVITATTTNFGTAKMNVTVLSLAGVSVEWHGVCWHPMSYGGEIYKLHLADFLLKTPPDTRVMIHASLFFTSDCTGWFDNMNDFDDMYPGGHYILGFRHYPDVIPSSAMFWIGSGRPADGRCPPGSLCSGCMVYTQSTPDCSTMP